jgi:hypothetical protein
MILTFSCIASIAQRAVRIDPDFYSEEIIITDTLQPFELKTTFFISRSEALRSIQDPVPLDSLEEDGIYLYRSGISTLLPVMLISRKEHWAMIPLTDFTGYGLPSWHQIKQKKLQLILIEASMKDRFFTSEEFPAGYRAEKGLLQIIDIKTGRRILLQESNLKIEQGSWSTGMQGSSASSYEQDLSLTFSGKKMNMKILSKKQRYTTVSGIDSKSKQVQLEYEFRKEQWVRTKAVILDY